METTVIGYKAKEIALSTGCRYVSAGLTNIPVNLVKRAQEKFLVGLDPKTRPSPLYIRGTSAESSKTSKPTIFS